LKPYEESHKLPQIKNQNLGYFLTSNGECAGSILIYDDTLVFAVPHYTLREFSTTGISISVT
jgi:hypothetical protein